MNQLDQLENHSVYLLREAYRHFDRLCMLWSVGKDSTVLLHLARKAFFGHVPFPLVHIDTGFEIPEVLEWRNRMAEDPTLTVIYGANETALAARTTFADTQHLLEDDPARLTRRQCCSLLRTQALKQTLDGSGPRYRFDRHSRGWKLDDDRAPWNGVIVGARADEEGSRSKERYFSPRDKNNEWHVGDQPPEFWNQFKTDFAPGTHVRIHPLLDWTEQTIWEYIHRERIPVVSLYFADQSGQRYRSLGCMPCQSAISSTARSVPEIITELASGQLRNIAERSGRLQDHEGRGGLEALRRDGYM